MKRKIIPIIIIFAGIALLLYPWIANYINEQSAQSTINTYKEKVKNTDKKDLEEMLAKAREYNKRLASSHIILTDPFAEDNKNGISEKEYYQLLNLDSTGVMCTLEIPSIDVDLPVYHGTSNDVLERGAGHLEGTSLPVGGKNTHAVFTGHTGLNKAKLFTDLTELQKGDQFYIHILGKTLAYEVDDINIVLPEDTSKLSIVNGKDYVTLITCTPYGENTHRLLVRGKRTKYSPKKYKEEKLKKKAEHSQWMRTYLKTILKGIGVTAGVLVIFTLITYIRKKLQKR